jgi:hypothetical protein
MRVGQAGHDRASAKIDYASAFAFVRSRVRVRPDKDNLARFDRYGLRARLPVIYRIDVAVLEDYVGNLSIAARGRDAQRGHHNDQEN